MIVYGLDEYGKFKISYGHLLRTKTKHLIWVNNFFLLDIDIGTPLKMGASHVFSCQIPKQMGFDIVGFPYMEFYPGPVEVQTCLEAKEAKIPIMHL